MEEEFKNVQESISEEELKNMLEPISVHLLELDKYTKMAITILLNKKNPNQIT